MAKFLSGTSRVVIFVCLLLSLAGINARPAGAAPLAALDTASPLAVEGGLKDGSAAWADYDNDGDLDLLVTGNNISGTSETSIFTNHNGQMLRYALGLPGVQSSSGEWGDYDNDGYPDVLLTGLRSIGDTQVLYSAVYHNIPASSPPNPAITRQFTRFQELQPIYRGAGVWGDYNNDGRLDILLTGYTTNDAPFSRIYTNTGSTFSALSYTVTALGSSAAAWTDFNNDGYSDFVITGRDVAGTPTARIYRNLQNSTFAEGILPAGLWSGTVTFFNADSDGVPELLLTGNSGGESSPNIQPQALLYRYSSTTAPYYSLSTGSGLTGVWSSAVSSGDFNNDGRGDLAIAGLTASGRLNRVYTNNGNYTFTLAHTLPDVSGLSVDWGDFDQDHTLDLAVSGVNAGVPVERYYLYIYANDDPPPPANAPPSAPELTAACWDGSSLLTLEWSAASDDHTGTGALTYNLRMGTTPGGVNTFSPGFVDPGKRLPQPGSTFTGIWARVRSLPGGTYYWSMQAVDSAYAAGPFAPGGVIEMGTSVAVADSFPDIVEDSRNNTLDVLANDNSGGETLSLKSFTDPRYGTLDRSAADRNVLLYTPNSNFFGSDSFTYYAQRSGSLYCSRAVVNITVDGVNDSPQSITLTNNEIAAGLPTGTEIGRFITTDIDSGQAYTYQLVPNASGNSYDNAYFSLYVNNSYNPPATFLRSARVFPVDGRDSYQIYVRSTDNGSPPLSVEALLTIELIEGVQATSIALDEDHVLEKQPANTRVGQLSTFYGTAEDTTISTYALVPDASGNPYNNSLFNIPTGPPWYLRTAAPLNYDEANPANNTLRVYVRTSHPTGTHLDQVLTIILDPTLPQVTALDDNNVAQTGAVTVAAREEEAKTITFRATDEGLSEVLRWDITDLPDHGTASLASGDTTSGQSKTASYTSADDWYGSDSFVVRVRDTDGNEALITVTINVANVNDPPTLDYIAPVTFTELSGYHEIIITGISAGPDNEIGQTVTVTPTWSGWPAPLGPVLTPVTSAVRPDGTATLRFFIGLGPGRYALILIASDGSPTSGQSPPRYLTITVEPGGPFYQGFMPSVFK